MTTKHKNRSLDTIADDINKLARTNIFDIGDLLLEAKEQCEHGDWLSWLWDEFEYPTTTAARYMNAARLRAKFPIMGNLKLAANTVYALADECEEGDLPAVIGELAKHATEKQLKHKDAERVIKIGIGRHRHGDHPDATLVWLIDLDDNRDDPWYLQAVAELLKQNPETNEIASSIVDEVWQAHQAAENARDEAKWKAERDAMERDQDEAEAILDGPPPELPPSIVPPEEEPQKFKARTEWAGTETFSDAVRELLALSTKPAERFVGQCPAAMLHAVSDFLMAVAKAAAEQHADKAKTEAA